MNSENLLKLANYLDSLPQDYQHFDMASYSTDDSLIVLEGFPGFVNHCGTTACAVGHGPGAGFAILPSEIRYNTVEWYDYSKRVFDVTGDTWDYMFSGEWDSFDNTPHGAAARIRYIVAGNPIPYEEDEGIETMDFDSRHYEAYRRVPA